MPPYTVEDLINQLKGTLRDQIAADLQTKFNESTNKMVREQKVSDKKIPKWRPSAFPDILAQQWELVINDNAYNALVKQVVYDILGMNGASATDYYVPTSDFLDDKQVRSWARLLVSSSTFKPSLDAPFTTLDPGDFISLRRDSYEKEFEYKWNENTKGFNYITPQMKAETKSRYMDYVDAVMGGNPNIIGPMKQSIPEGEQWVLAAADGVTGGVTTALDKQWSSVVVPLLPRIPVPKALEPLLMSSMQDMLTWADITGVTITDGDARLYNELLGSIYTDGAPSTELLALTTKRNSWMVDRATSTLPPKAPKKSADITSEMAAAMPSIRKAFGNVPFEQLSTDLKDQIAELFTPLNDLDGETLDVSRFDWRVRALQNYLGLSRDDSLWGKFVDIPHMEEEFAAFSQSVAPLLSADGLSKLNAGFGEFKRDYLLSRDANLDPQAIQGIGGTADAPGSSGFTAWLHKRVTSTLWGEAPIVELATANQKAQDKQQAAEDLARIEKQLAVSGEDAVVQRLVAMGLDPNIAKSTAAGFTPRKDEQDDVWKGRVVDILTRVIGATKAPVSVEDLFFDFERMGYFTSPVQLAEKAAKVEARTASDKALLSMIARSSGDAGYAALIDAGLDPEIARQLAPSFTAQSGETASEYEKRIRAMAKAVAASVNLNKREDEARVDDTTIFTSFRNTIGVFDMEADWHLGMGTPNTRLGQSNRPTPADTDTGLTANEARSTYATFIEEMVGSIDPNKRNAFRTQMLRNYDSAVVAWQQEQAAPPTLPPDAMEAYQKTQDEIAANADLQNTFLTAALKSRNITPEEWAEIVVGSTAGMKLGPGEGTPGVEYTGPREGVVPGGGVPESSIKDSTTEGVTPANAAAMVTQTRLKQKGILPEQYGAIYKDIMGGMYGAGSGGYTDTKKAQKKKQQQQSFGDFLKNNRPDLSSFQYVPTPKAPITYVR